MKDYFKSKFIIFYTIHFRNRKPAVLKEAKFVKLFYLISGRYTRCLTIMLDDTWDIIFDYRHGRKYYSALTDVAGLIWPFMCIIYERILLNALPGVSGDTRPTPAPTTTPDLFYSQLTFEVHHPTRYYLTRMVFFPLSFCSYTTRFKVTETRTQT